LDDHTFTPFHSKRAARFLFLHPPGTPKCLLHSARSKDLIGGLVNNRILVVEDNSPNAELLTQWLESEGYEVLNATDLNAAFHAVQQLRPHAVLLDVQLGGENGLSLATWMRQQPTLRHIPVIAVTAHAMVSERDRILLAGCNACIPKPVDFKLLRENLERWLAPKRIQNAGS
jgi:two-component system cell cycle response regulator DivK